MTEVFNLLINMISKCTSWLFTLVINESPRFTLGEFILACAFIGVVLYFILGTDFFPGHMDFNFGSGKSTSYNPKHTYQPKHSSEHRAIKGKHISGNTPGPRESRHN